MEWASGFKQGRHWHKPGNVSGGTFSSCETDVDRGCAFSSSRTEVVGDELKWLVWRLKMCPCGIEVIIVAP